MKNDKSAVRSTTCKPIPENLQVELIDQWV